MTGLAGFNNIKICWETRLCKVDGELGYFHTWEQYSRPIGASPMVGGATAGVVSQIHGIVEFEDGVRRVDPTCITFCDEVGGALHVMNKFEKEKEQ